MLIQQKLFKSLNVVENTSRILMKKYVTSPYIAKRQQREPSPYYTKNYLINVPFSTFSLQRERKFSKELPAYSLYSEKVLKGTFIKFI